MPVTVADIIAAIGELAPWDLAEEWDNAGLQVGSRQQAVATVAVALDPGPEEVARALEAGAHLLVTHHPLLFHPLRQVDLDDPAGRVLSRIIAGGLTVVSAHTNLDSAPGGLADLLARRLGLTRVESLAPSPDGARLKLVVFVPEGDAERLAAALKEVGAGRIGRYAGCSFAVAGTGRFTPLPGATPTMGRVGREEQVREIRLETVIHRRRIAEALSAVRRVHPYEEPALDLYPLLGSEEGAGPGRVGERDLSPEELVGEVKRALNCGTVRTVGEPPPSIRKVAVVPGSGGDFLGAARAAGADVLVTGEVRYHQALDASARGLWLIEAGHRVSEAPAVPLLAGHLEECSRDRGWNLRVESYEPRGDIFVTR